MERLRSRGALSFTRWPPMIMSPLVMSSSPTSIRSSVDFPHPDGPTRIMNSPSAMSRLTSLTAGKPSPYCLTMFSISMEAIGRPLLGVGGWKESGGESALDRTVGQAGHDPPLEQQDEHDHRDGDDHGGRGGDARRVLELGGSREEAEGGRDRTGAAGRGERDPVGEVVPGDEEGDDRRREHARGGQRDDHLAEGLPGGGTVDLRSLLHLPGDLPEERRHGPDRDRQGQGQVRDD